MNRREALTPLIGVPAAAEFSMIEWKVIQKQVTPPPVTNSLGTGTSATRVDFLVVLPIFGLAEYPIVVRPGSTR